jgi:hypothetical protein
MTQQLQKCLFLYDGIAVKQTVTEQKASDLEHPERKAPRLRLSSTLAWFCAARTDGMRVVRIATMSERGWRNFLGNIGLPSYQVALGFSASSNRSEAVRFADKVTAPPTTLVTNHIEAARRIFATVNERHSFLLRDLSRYFNKQKISCYELSCARRTR